MRVSENQLTLRDLIQILKRKDPEQHIYFDFVHFEPDTVHSYRGYYEDLAIGYKDGYKARVGELLAKLEAANGKQCMATKGVNIEWATILFCG